MEILGVIHAARPCFHEIIITAGLVLGEVISLKKEIIHKFRDTNEMPAFRARQGEVM
jgi:hypothetical protein